jgi:hypothetical protein
MCVLYSTHVIYHRCFVVEVNLEGQQLQHFVWLADNPGRHVWVQRRAPSGVKRGAKQCSE